MALYDRLMGLNGAQKIPVHSFFAAMQEFALGNMTQQQAIDAFSLSGPEATEANTLKTVILNEPSANNNIARRVKAIELENVLILAESLIPPYDTVAAVKTRLGV